MEMLKVQIVILVMMELLDFHNALGHVIVRMKGQLAAMKLANVFARIILKEYLAIIAWTTSLVTQNAKIVDVMKKVQTVWIVITMESVLASQM